MTEAELLTQLIAQLSAKEQLKNRYKPTIEMLERDLTFAKLDKYRVGVIGVTSSGKSTLINAILGDELLSMAVKPSSSQLVSCSKHNKRRATVYFQDKSPVEYTGTKLTKEIIRKYADENYNAGNKEKVKQVELSTPKFALSEDILLIDSPGLDAYGLDIHETLTLETLLPTIDFCIFVTTMKTNSDEKMKSVLDKIAGYDCPVIIVQNMLDSVKPSPDGKKSVKDVANEHKSRVERIVNQSKITNKDSVRIVQISATHALKGRKEKDEIQLEKWGYNTFISAVDKTLNAVKPRIEEKALRTIKERILKLISQAKQDMSADGKKLTDLKFEFEGVDTQITNAYEDVRQKLQSILMTMADALKSLKERESGGKKSPLGEYAPLAGLSAVLSGYGEFSEKDIDKIIDFKKQCENRLLKEMSKYNSTISKYCKMLGESERRLKKIESFGAVPELRPRTMMKPTLKRKTDGPFGGKVARFFGDIFGTNWGYEKVPVSVFDAKASLKAAVKYLETVTRNCTADCIKWLESAESQAEQLCGIVKRKFDENQARKADIPDKKAMLEMISSLEELYCRIPDVRIDSSGTVKHTDTDLKLSFEGIEIDRKIYGIYELAEIIKRKISFYVMQKIHTELCCAGLDLIISWDAMSASAFLNNSFGKTVSDDSLKGINRLESVTIVVLPTENGTAEIKSMIRDFRRNGGTNLFVMFNAIQYGEARSALERLGIFTALNAGDRLFLVAQDFEELINGDCVSDALRNMKEACLELNTKARCSILINSENPVYQLTALYAELSNPHILIDEVNCLSELQKHFPFLLTRASKRTVSEIIRAYRTNDC